MTRRLTRRAFLGMGVAALGAGAAGYGWGVEPGWLEVRFVRVVLSRRLPNTVRILHLSDLHWSSFVSLAFIRKAIDLGLAHHPDVVCLTGDFVTAGDERNLTRYVPVLRLLSSATPTFAVLGNHDGGIWSGARGGYRTSTEIATMLERSGIVVLDNRAVIIGTEESRITVIGTSDLWAGGFDPSAAFERTPNDHAGPTILLAHNPDTKDEVGGHTWDLMLSGHTHGGQVVIPFLGAPLVNVKDRRYLRGLNPWKGRMVYTNRGVGNLYGLRLNCRPEVAIIQVT